MQKQVSPNSVGLTITVDENGHWSVWRGTERVSGPLFNRPEIWKMVSKGEVKTTVKTNPTSDNPQYFLV